MSRLLITLVTGLLWAVTSTTHARELNPRDPVRASLVNMARDTPIEGLPSDSRMTLSRAWVDGSQATVCALARRADGDLLVQDGYLQMRRVYLRKRGSDWGVERAERIVLGPKMTIDTACKQLSPETIMAEAIKILEDHPPTAGIKAHTPVASRNCHDAAPRQASNQSTGPGLVALAGKSLLHTAPDTNCLMGKHIVEGDKVAILAHVPGWAQVRYTHPLTGAVTVAWLKSERVKLSASGEPSQAPVSARTAQAD
jgi:hypothetical protein